MGSKPVGSCVNIKYTILPTLWDGSYHPLRSLGFMNFSGERRPWRGLEFSSKIIFKHSALWGRNPSVSV